MFNHKPNLVFHSLLLIVLSALLLLPALPVRAADAVVGDGTAASCTEGAFDVALDTVQTTGGGTITFDCGIATIDFNSEKLITTPVTIDGGGLITLSGRGATRLLRVLGGGSLTLQTIVLTDGYAGDDYGGAIYVQEGGELVLQGSTIRNSATNGWAGGAIVAFQAPVSLTDSLIENNQSSYGAINSTGPLTLLRTVVRSNQAFLGGGGLSVGGLVTIQDSLIADNTAPVGGGIYITSAAQVTITGSRLERNSANAPIGSEASGGAIMNDGELTIRRSTFSGNTSGGDGGALRSGFTHYDAYAAIYTSTFYDNQAGTVGGAIDNNGGTLYIYNSTISGNTASMGGAIESFVGPVTLSYSTVVGNYGGNLDQLSVPGYIDNARQRFYLVRTVLAGGGSEGNCLVRSTPGPLPPFVSQGYNLSDDATCADYLSQNGDSNAVEPWLAALADNGGPTLTHLPLEGSPLIDAAACEFDFMVDQRGVSRPQGATCDIGAVEVAPAGAPPSTPPPTATPLPTPRPTATVPAPGAPTPSLTPVRAPGGLRPSISVSPSHAFGSQRVTISGQGVPGYNQVRLLSVERGQTVGAVETNVNGNGRYQADLIVPVGLPPATIDLCALAVGAANAELECTPFIIDPMPAGAVAGQIQAANTATWDAQVNLIDPRGRLAASAPVDVDGRFELNDVPPGVYQYAVSGQTSGHVNYGEITVGLASQIGLNPLEGVALCVPGASRTSSVVLLDREQPNVPPGDGDAYAPVLLANFHPWEDALANVQLDWTKFQREKFGYYVSGVARDETFRAIPQVSGTVQKVIFQLVDATGAQVGAAREDSSAPYTATFDMAALPPSSAAGDPQIWVIPVVGGQEQCPSAIDIQVLADPMNHPLIRTQDRSTRWDAQARVYRFQGVIPNIPGLPFQFDIPPKGPGLDYFGYFHNRIDAGVYVQGYLTEDGLVLITAVNAKAELTALNAVLISPTDLKVISLPEAIHSIDELRNIKLKLPPDGGAYTVLPKLEVGVPFVVTPVLTFFGLIEATVGSSAKASFEVTLQGEVAPFRPAAAVTLTASGKGEGELTVGLGLLSGVVSAGAGAGFGIDVDLPLTAKVLPDPSLELNICPTIRVFMHAYAQALWGLARKDAYKDLASLEGCFKLLGTEPPFPTAPAPEVFAAPSVAADPSGRVLSAYVENTAAPGETPQVQIMARFQDPANGQWLAATPLSDPAHSATNPVVAFVGPSYQPMVVWVEKPYDAAIAAALGEDLNAHVQRQELFYSIFVFGRWSPPVRLTTDLQADGMPAIAGSSAGAVLAWTRDMDANMLTRDDQRIAVSRYDPFAREFGPFQLLSGGATGLNGDVRAAYDTSTASPVPYLAWVYDGDADLETAEDRRLVIAHQENGVWVTASPSSLPVRVDSPALTATGNDITLAFLVRDPLQDGSVGMMGANGVLWTAHQEQGEWVAAPLRGSQGELVYGEQPLLASNQEETLLAFRRFGEQDSNAGLGQISLSSLQADGSFSAPLYMTDEARQNWQPALAVNPISRQALILKVGRPANIGTQPNSHALAAISADQATMATTRTTLAAADDPVEAVGVVATADPALDPLRTSVPSALPGSQIALYATLRNVGRDPANDVMVRLYAGTPGSGTLLDTQSVAGPLGFNQTAPLTFTLTVTPGEQPVYAELTTSGGNASSANDQATLTLGQLSAPTMDSVVASPFTGGALDVTWYPVVDQAVSSYRVLRGAGPAGPFEVIGETVRASFTDALVEQGKTYCYAVQSYNGGGNLSPRSDVICGGLTLHQIFLPLILH